MVTIQWFGASFLLTAGLVAGLAFGCGGVDSGGPASSTSSSGTGGGGGGSGLPCDVAGLLTSKCIACHSNPPVAGAPMPLLDYADLAAHSKVTPAKTYAELAVERMQDAQKPMPP